MKIPECLCGAIRGFYHELKCRSCCTYPWQHSSADECSSGPCSDDEWQYTCRRIREEIEADRQRKCDATKKIIDEAEFYDGAKSDLFSAEDKKIFQRLQSKRKRLLKRSQRDQRRSVKRTPIEEKPYSLNVYEYYQNKDKYKKQQLSEYFFSMGLDEDYTPDRFLVTRYCISEFGLETFEEAQANGN